MILARWFWGWVLIKLSSLFRRIEFSFSKFDSLDPTYQTSKARIRYVGKDPAILLTYIFPVENAIKARSCIRFWFILHGRNNFFKIAPKARDHDLQGYRPAPAKIWKYNLCATFWSNLLLLRFCRFEHLCETIDQTSCTLNEIGNAKIWMFSERYRRSHSSRRNKKKLISCQTFVSQQERVRDW